LSLSCGDLAPGETLPSARDPTAEGDVMFKNVLIPTDGTDLAKKAMRAGIDLAKLLGASVTLVTVSAPLLVVAVDDPVFYPELQRRFLEETEKAARERLKEGEEIAAANGVAVKTTHVRDASVYHGILAAAKQNGCDLIFMASHGRRGVVAVLLGSETLKVLTHSTIPVLAYR
jgi:nucleotide-binding universal stress UspA family protein